MRHRHEPGGGFLKTFDVVTKGTRVTKNAFGKHKVDSGQQEQKAFLLLLLRRIRISSQE